MTGLVTSPDTVLFDIGNVLVDWSPEHLYRKIFQGRPNEMSFFLSNVCNQGWNERHDAGAQFQDTVPALIAAHPWYAAEISAYWHRWFETVNGEIQGSVRLLERLHDRRLNLHALTNFSAETFPYAERSFDWLGLFGHVVVSGRIGMMKPDAAIFRHATDACDLVPERTLFVDDMQRNTDAASGLGFHTHLFRTPDGLEVCLKDHGLL